ncbi:hypothetical protein SETIT_1G049800v2 [Setaria italica]|uniref:Secreted protein n=1 Tax=Setaria italica TaxID=4555 RepID=A0A368PHS8_SETIT|nr:hypothetical protein SETIT_1G049800v2 [Setaria italica]
MICKIQSCIFAALSLNFPFLFAATSPSCSTLMHMHPGSCKNSSPVESKMVCVLAMLCSSVMYYCLVRVTSQSVIVISNGLPYFLAIFWFSSFHVRL